MAVLCPVIEPATHLEGHHPDRCPFKATLSYGRLSVTMVWGRPHTVDLQVNIVNVPPLKAIGAHRLDAHAAGLVSEHRSEAFEHRREAFIGNRLAFAASSCRQS